MAWTEYGSGDGQVAPGIPDDLERPETASKDPLAGGTGRRYGDSPEEADLFKMDERACAIELQRRWSVQDSLWQKPIIEYKVNARRLAGDTNVWAAKERDLNSWIVYDPPGKTSTPVAVFNKSYRLCERFTSNVFADDPKIEAAAPPNDPKGADRAKLAGRVLEDVDSEGRLNDLQAAREAFGRWGSVTGSGYVHYFVDPHIGGRQPITIQASPNAQSVEDATRDPLTGQPWPGELVERYVREDGTLSDDAGEAALQWQPGLTRDIVGAHHVRFEPWSALDAWDAEGVHVAGYYPWAQVVRWFPKLAELEEEEQDRLARVRPAKTQDLLPWRDGIPKDSPAQAKRRERLTWVQWSYYLECPAYPDGFHGVLVGDHLARRTTWVSLEGGRLRYDLPITQYKQFRAPDGSPHGWGMMHLLGPASEWRAELVATMEDVLDRIRNRKTFVPVNSNLQAKSWLMQAMTYIPINDGGEPKYEEVPTDALKPASELFAINSREMDDASTLQEAGQGMQVPSVTSGKQAQMIQSQVQAGQSEIRKNCANALVRAARIKLQLLRGIAQAPQLVKYAADDSDLEESWTSADLRGVTNLRLVPGSFSGLTAMQKAERAMFFGQANLMPPDELAEAVQSAIGSTFGWDENPHARHARKQISQWERAVKALTPDQRIAPPPMVPQEQQQPPIIGPDGMQYPVPPVVTQVPGPDPAAAAIFEPRPVDGEPRVAAMRARIFGNAMVGEAYGAAPPAWRIALDQAYQAAVMAAQPPMPMAPDGQAGGQAGGPAMAAPEAGETPDAAGMAA